MTEGYFTGTRKWALLHNSWVPAKCTSKVPHEKRTCQWDFLLAGFSSCQYSLFRSKLFPFPSLFQLAMRQGGNFSYMRQQALKGICLGAIQLVYGVLLSMRQPWGDASLSGRSVWSCLFTFSLFLAPHFAVPYLYWQLANQQVHCQDSYRRSFGDLSLLGRVLQEHLQSISCMMLLGFSL